MVNTPFSHLLALATAVGGTLLAMPAAAQPYSVSGELQVRIELVESCKINNAEQSEGSSTLNFGTINFGEQTTFFTETTAAASGGFGATLTILCTPGISPKLSFDGGEHAGDGEGVGTRAMGHATSLTHFVTYNLLNAGTLIPINTELTYPSTGAPISLNITGKAFGEDGLIAGLYQDTVTVTLKL
jgi:spore coat protein U-like protein